MAKFVVSTDSTCDLYADEIRNNDIYFVPLVYTLTENGNVIEYKDEYKSYSEYVDYYNELRRGVVSKTSMLNLFAHLEHFTKMAESGIKDAIHFTISYGLSPTVDVARQAVKTVQETYPDFNCLCVESNTTTIGQGMLVKTAVDMRDKGCSLKETFEYVESVKSKIQHFIVVDSLMYLMRGGRISAASATVGTILNVKPVLIFNKTGKLVKYKQASGMKHTISMIVKEFEKYSLNKQYPKVYIVHTDNTAMAEYMKKCLMDNFQIDAEIRIIGPIIGSHLGPNAVAFAFMSNEERPM